MQDIFLRTRMILGDAAMESLAGSHVAVFGLGGVGSYAVEALARSGVGQLTLVDRDTVSPSNINRQLYALHSTIGQPKVLDYLKDHDGACQKDIAAGCHIEPASITAVLSGMENKGYIQRSTKSGDRRSLYVYLTDKGREYVEMLNKKFDLVESLALRGFTAEETEELQSLLVRVYDNMKGSEKDNRKEERKR